MRVLGTPTLLLLVGICLTAGLVLFVLGLWPRSHGKDPHTWIAGNDNTDVAYALLIGLPGAAGW